MENQQVHHIDPASLYGLMREWLETGCSYLHPNAAAPSPRSSDTTTRVKQAFEARTPERQKGNRIRRVRTTGNTLLSISWSTGGAGWRRRRTQLPPRRRFLSQRVIQIHWLAPQIPPEIDCHLDPR